MSYPEQPPPAQPGQPWPPQQHYAAPPVGPPAKPPNPRLVFWTSGTGVVIMLLIAFVAVILLAGVVNRINGPASAAFDTTITSCEATGSSTLATATVGLTVKNVSKSTKSATVKLEYRDGSGSRIDTDTAYVRDIAPGDTARTEESTILDAAPAGSIECVVTGVS
jgi:hypothetical protein